MRNFTLTNYLSGECRSYGRLTKALLLFTAMVLFHFTSLQAQEAVDAEQTTQIGQTTTEFYGDGVPGDASNIDAKGPRKLSDAWFAKNNIDPENCVDPADYQEGDELVCNPDLPFNINCTELRVVLLLDESGSILNRNGVEQVRESTLGLAEVFLGSPAFLTVVEFGSQATEIDLGSNFVTPAFLANLENYLYDEHNGQTYDPNSIGINEPCFDKYTNWEDAFLTTLDIDPNLLLFLTDGEPSAYNVDPNNPDDVANDPNNCGFVSGGGQATFEIGLERAIPVANQLKLNGVHIFGLGVGDGVLVDNLQLVTGPDNFADNQDIFTADYSVGSFETLRDDLAAGLNSICGTELELTKTVNIDQVCGEETIFFTLTVENTGGSNDFEAVDVVVQDVFPDAFSNLNIELINGDIVADIDGQTLTVNVGNLEANIPPGTIPTVVVSATVSGPNNVYTNFATANAANANQVEAEASVTKTDLITSAVMISACQSFDLVADDYIFNPDPNQDEILEGSNITESRTITGFNESGCPEEVNLQITLNGVPDPELVVVEEAACGSYTWIVNDVEVGTFTPADLEEGPITYLEGEDDCAQLYILDVEILEPFIVVAPDPLVICPGDDITLPGGGTIDNVEIGENGDVQLGENFIELEGVGQGPCSAVWNVFIQLGDDCEILDPCEGIVCEDDGDPCTTVSCVDGVCVTVNLPDSDGDGVCDAEDECPGFDDNVDSDGDGIADGCDTCDGNLEGTSCDDGDDCTTGDVYDAECNCVGTFQDADDDGVCDADDICPGFDDNADADGDGIPDGCDTCDGTLEGTSCNDGDDCTTGDVYDAECNCAGTFQDADDDGVCDADDICPGFDDNADADGDGIPDGCDTCDGTLEGTSCNDGDDCTTGDVYDADCDCAGTFQDTDGDEICDNEDDCPFSFLQNGDDCATAFGQAGTVQDCQCVPENNPDVIDCEDWVVYLADILPNGVTNIYAVDFDGSDANLELIATSAFQVHIAYNSADNLLYAVRQSNGSYRTLNPHEAGAEFSESVSIGSTVGNIVTATFTEDGKLLIGSQNSGVIYRVNVDSDNSVEVIDGDSPISGGDIAVGQIGLDAGRIFLATRAGGGKLFRTSSDEILPDEQIGTTPSLVTGMALSSTNQLLLSHRDATTLEVRNLDGSVADAFNLKLEGESFETFNGDMASGCNSSENNEDDCAYKLYYTHSGPGAQDGLYELTLNENGTADVDFKTSEGGRHIALSPDGTLIYMVGGSAIETYDVATGVITSVNIYNGANNANLSGFPAAVADSDGNVFIAGAGSNVWQVDPISGEATNIASGISVNGGDLIVAPTGMNGMDELWIITRNNNRFRRVLDPDNGSFTVAVPEINGAAVLENGNVLLANGDGDGIAGYVEVSLADGSIVNNYNVDLPIFNGDLAGGCTEAEDEIVCTDGGECYATSAVYVEGTTQGGGAIATNRTNPMNAVGDPELTDALVFTSLGYGGSLTFQFDGVVPNGPDDDLKVIETSFSNIGCESYPEYADVSVSVDGNTFYYLGTVCKNEPFVDIDDAVDSNGEPVALSCVVYVRVANNDDDTESPDGFDVDGIIAIHNCDNNGSDQEPPVIGLEANNALTSFPNPTDGLSQAVFVTAQTERATLEVYDMNGRVVETLFNQMANANQEYRVDFDGMKLPNGVYVYRLTTDSEVTVEKFMIAK